MLRALFSGRENWPAMGMKSWGITEQAPMMSDAAQMMWMSFAMPMSAAIAAAVTMLTRMMRRREYRSPMGMMKQSPTAYPICVMTVIMLAAPDLLSSPDSSLRAAAGCSKVGNSESRHSGHHQQFTLRGIPFIFF